MSIRALSQQEFDGFHSAPSTLAGLTRRAVAWFADDRVDIIGAIIEPGTDRGWSAVVIGPDEGSQFRGLDLTCGLHDPSEARHRLFEHMEETACAATVRRGSFQPAGDDGPRSA